MSAFPEIVRFEDCAAQPWANGGGSTRVIAVGPDDAGDGVFDWRLSVATVNSGAFSQFPGVDRIIVLVDGPTMTLTIDGVPHVLDPFRPKSFAGEAVVSAEVSLQCLDFNVMTRRGACSADVSVRIGSGHVGAPIDCRTFIAPLSGSATVRSAGGRVVGLGRFDTVMLSGAAEVCVGSGARVAVVRVKRIAGQPPF